MRIQEQTKDDVNRLMLAAKGASKGERMKIFTQTHTILVFLLEYCKSVRNMFFGEFHAYIEDYFST